MTRAIKINTRRAKKTLVKNEPKRRMKRQNGILFNEHSRLPSNLAIRKDVVNRISNPLTIITRNNTKKGQFTSLDEPVDSKFDQQD